MAMSYNQLLSYAENIMVDTGSTDFINVFPAAIQYAEDRIFRDLDILHDRVSDTSVILSAGSRNATCPSTISVVEGINLLTPAGQTPPSATRVSLERMSLDFIDFAYGAESTTGTPAVFAMKTDTSIVLAPTPSSAWNIEIIGTGQAEAMSNSNQTTWLGDNLPDLLLAGVIIFLAGWQQNYGTETNNPQMAQSWEAQYQTLKTSALEFVQRQKSQDPNWTPYSPTPLSTPRT